MKKPFLTLVVLLLTILTMVLFVSCQKEKTNETPTTQKDASPQEAINRLVEFKNQVESHRKNPSERTSEIIGLEDAVRDIENTFNATYSQPEVVCSATSEFEFSLYLTVDADNNVQLYDLLDLYDEAVASAREAYANDGFTNKVFRLLLVDADNPTNGVVRLRFKGRTGERSSEPQTPDHDTVSHWVPFHSGDNYHYDYGKCDGTGIDGADEKLTQYIQPYITSLLSTPPVGMRAIYINTIEIRLKGSDYQNDLFYSADVTSTCIDFINMNRLYNTEKTLITETLPEDPQGEVYGMTPTDISVQSDTNQSYISHDNYVTYAQRVIAYLNDVGDMEDLLNE